MRTSNIILLYSPNTVKPRIDILSHTASEFVQHHRRAETTATHTAQLTNACPQIWTSHKRRTKRPAPLGQSERRCRPPARNHLSYWLSRNDLVFGGNFSGVLWCLRRCAVDVTRYFIEARLFEFLYAVVIIIRLCMWFT